MEHISICSCRCQAGQKGGEVKGKLLIRRSHGEIASFVLLMSANNDDNLFMFNAIKLPGEGSFKVNVYLFSANNY